LLSNAASQLAQHTAFTLLFESKKSTILAMFDADSSLKSAAMLRLSPSLTTSSLVCIDVAYADDDDVDQQSSRLNGCVVVGGHDDPGDFGGGDGVDRRRRLCAGSASKVISVRRSSSDVVSGDTTVSIDVTLSLSSLSNVCSRVVCGVAGRRGAARVGAFDDADERVAGGAEIEEDSIAVRCRRGEWWVS
jgi:hypothetical protein